jgi:hypothetical protein
MRRSNHVDAIFTLRAAAEKKGRIERDVDADPTPANRDLLLEAQIELERATIAALETYEPTDREETPVRARSNVVHVDFDHKPEEA